MGKGGPHTEELDRQQAQPEPGAQEHVLVVGDEPLAVELLHSLRELGLLATGARTAEGVHAVLEEAPDLVVLVGSARRGGAGRLLEPLHQHPTSAGVPVVLLGDTAELPLLAAGEVQRIEAAQAVVGRMQRDLGALLIAREVQRILRELPTRMRPAQDVVAEATLDELVDLLSRELRQGERSPHDHEAAHIALRAGASGAAAHRPNWAMGLLRASRRSPASSAELPRPEAATARTPAPLVSAIPGPPRLPSGDGLRAAQGPLGDTALGLALVAIGFTVATLIVYVVWI